MIALSQTQIPQNFSVGLYNDKGYDVPADLTDAVGDIVFTGVASLLGATKNREFPVAFVFEQNNGDFVAAAIIQFMKNEDDKSKPGSWDYSWTWYKDDVPENARIQKINDPQYTPYFRGVSQGKYGMAFRDTAAVVEVTRFFLEQVKKWLEENASETEEVGVEQEGVFQATVAVENGEKVFSLVPEGEVKKLIKDDASIEVN